MATELILIRPIMRRLWAEPMNTIRRSVVVTDNTRDRNVLDACLRQSLNSQYAVTPERKAYAWNRLRAAAEQQAAALQEQAAQADCTAVVAPATPIMDSWLRSRVTNRLAHARTDVMAQVQSATQHLYHGVHDALFEHSLLNMVEICLIDDAAYKRAGARSTLFGCFGTSFGYAYPAAMGRLSFA